MAGITLSVDTETLRSQLRGLYEKDIPFLTAYALTKSGQDVKDAEVAEMEQVFDRPTRYTLNALRLKPATKEDLTAVVDFKEFGGTPAWKFLGPEVEGGPRNQKGHERALVAAGVMRADEYAVPGQGVVLDASGNMPGSLIARILSDLKASPDPAQNVTARSLKRRSKQGGYSYFVRRGPGAPAGIYWKSPGTRRIVPIILFVRAPTYQPRYPFYETAKRIIQTNFARHFLAGFRRYADGGKLDAAAA